MSNSDNWVSRGPWQRTVANGGILEPYRRAMDPPGDLADEVIADAAAMVETGIAMRVALGWSMGAHGILPSLAVEFEDRLIDSIVDNITASR